ncbi:MAG: glycosyltransferase, partial [Ktedonobacteraceae bacterium]
DGASYHTAHQVPSLLNESDRCLFSVQILANNCLEEARRCVESVFRYAGTQAIEIMLIDNASQDELVSWAQEYQRDTALLHLIHISRVMGAAEAYNLGLQQSRGRFILQLDPSFELTGDIFTPLAQLLENAEIGITGPRGLYTDDLRHFAESEEDEVEAIDGSCMAFSRNVLKQAGFFDEGYRFPTYMDIDFNFAVRANALQALVVHDLPLIRHPALSHTAYSDAQTTRLTKRNFYRFLDRWGDREDLLLNGLEDDEEYEDEDEDEENEDA